jgi:methyltransferase-like protein
MVTGNFGPEVEKALGVVAADQVQAEQYMDFVRNRTFRETLLVRAEATPNWSINPDAVLRLHVTTPRRIPEDPGDVRSTATVQYHTASGMTLSTASPVLKAAMRILSRRWPATVPFAELDREVVAALSGESDGGKALAMGLLSTFLASDLLELHAAPIRAVVAGERPVALAVARARLTAGEAGVTTRRHEFYKASDLDRQLIPLLDGTRDRVALLDRLTELTLAGELTVERQGQRVTDPAELRTTLAGVLDTTLADLGKLGLLAG